MTNRFIVVKFGLKRTWKIINSDDKCSWFKVYHNLIVEEDCLITFKPFQFLIVHTGTHHIIFQQEYLTLGTFTSS